MPYPTTEFYRYADSAILTDRFPESDIYWRDVKVIIDMELPTGKEWEAARNAIATDPVFGEWLSGSWLTDMTALEESAHGFIERYFDDIAAENDFSSYDRKDFNTFSYFLKDYGRFMEPYGNYLCYKRSSILQMGHTDCVDIERYYCFDMMSGKLAEGFIPSGKNRTKAAGLIRRKLKENPSILSGNMESIEPSDNCYVSEKGVTFVYEPWQFSAAGDSSIHVTLSWEELSPYQR